MADNCKPENKYPPKPCPCPEIPGPAGPQGPIGLQGPQGDPGEDAGPFAAEVNYSAPTLSLTITGGTLPFTYQWLVKSNAPSGIIPGSNILTYTGSTTSATATYAGGTGLVGVKITDANGLVTYGYYFVFETAN